MAAQHGRMAGGLENFCTVAPLSGTLQPLVAKPIPEFMHAMKSVADADIIPHVLPMAEQTLEMARDAKQFGHLQDDPLSAEGVAFMMKYSAEDTVPAFYKEMNNRCYDPDRSKFAPFGPYAVGCVKHMKAIEPYANGTVLRGVKADLSKDYPKGREFVWHGFCSTTKSMEVLSNPMFCGDAGKRTIFQIQLTQGQAREITRYSLVQAEDEVLLPPGCKFKVESTLPQGDLTLIQLKEMPSKAWIIDLSLVDEEVSGDSAMQTPAANNGSLGLTPPFAAPHPTSAPAPTGMLSNMPALAPSKEEAKAAKEAKLAKEEAKAAERARLQAAVKAATAEAATSWSTEKVKLEGVKAAERAELQAAVKVAMAEVAESTTAEKARMKAAEAAERAELEAAANVATTTAKESYRVEQAELEKSKAVELGQLDAAHRERVRAAEVAAAEAAVQHEAAVATMTTRVAAKKAGAQEAVDVALAAEALAIEKCTLRKLEEPLAAIDEKDLKKLDKDVKICTQCSAKFGVKTRKHHCRQCHGVFCDSCSGKTSTATLECYREPSKKASRVCDMCHAILSANLEAGFRIGSCISLYSAAVSGSTIGDTDACVESYNGTQIIVVANGNRFVLGSTLSTAQEAVAATEGARKATSVRISAEQSAAALLQRTAQEMREISAQWECDEEALKQRHDNKIQEAEEALRVAEARWQQEQEALKQRHDNKIQEAEEALRVAEARWQQEEELRAEMCHQGLRPEEQEMLMREGVTTVQALSSLSVDAFEACGINITRSRKATRYKAACEDRDRTRVEKEDTLRAAVTGRAAQLRQVLASEDCLISSAGKELLCAHLNSTAQLFAVELQKMKALGLGVLDIQHLNTTLQEGVELQRCRTSLEKLRMAVGRSATQVSTGALSSLAGVGCESWEDIVSCSHTYQRDSLAKSSSKISGLVSTCCALQGALDAITVASLGLAAEDLSPVQGWIEQHNLRACAQLGCGKVFTLARGGGRDCGVEIEWRRQRQCVHCKRPFT
eukprot:COSAG02_NODE_3752_length_6284_cov_8.897171_4_plen_1014_part_00